MADEKKPQPPVAVTCKVVSKTQRADDGGAVTEVRLLPIKLDGKPGVEVFGKGQPKGEITLNVAKDAMADRLKIGASFVVTFTPVEEDR